MNELDEISARDAATRDPEFSLRILWIWQVLVFVFLGTGIVMTCIFAIKAISGKGHAGSILPPACWTFFVAVLSRGGMARIKDMRKEKEAQQRSFKTLGTGETQ